MNPFILPRPQMTLMGLSVLGDSRTDIPDLWQRFDQMAHRIHFAVPAARYIIITWGIETELNRLHYLFAGVQILKVEAPPISTVIKILPKAQYAIFYASASKVETAWTMILDEWLPASPYAEPGFIILRYDRKRYLEARPGRKEIDIYVPLHDKVQTAP